MRDSPSRVLVQSPTELLLTSSSQSWSSWLLSSHCIEDIKFQTQTVTNFVFGKMSFSSKFFNPVNPHRSVVMCNNQWSIFDKIIWGANHLIKMIFSSCLIRDPKIMCFISSKVWHGSVIWSVATRECLPTCAVIIGKGWDSGNYKRSCFLVPSSLWNFEYCNNKKLWSDHTIKIISEGWEGWTLQNVLVFHNIFLLWFHLFYNRKVGNLVMCPIWIRLMSQFVMPKKCYCCTILLKRIAFSFGVSAILKQLLNHPPDRRLDG